MPTIAQMMAAEGSGTGPPMNPWAADGGNQGLLQEIGKGIADDIKLSVRSIPHIFPALNPAQGMWDKNATPEEIQLRRRSVAQAAMLLAGAGLPKIAGTLLGGSVPAILRATLGGRMAMGAAEMGVFGAVDRGGSMGIGEVAGDVASGAVFGVLGHGLATRFGSKATKEAVKTVVRDVEALAAEKAKGTGISAVLHDEGTAKALEQVFRTDSPEIRAVYESLSEPAKAEVDRHLSNIFIAENFPKLSQAMGIEPNALKVLAAQEDLDVLRSGMFAALKGTPLHGAKGAEARHELYSTLLGKPVGSWRSIPQDQRQELTRQVTAWGWQQAAKKARIDARLQGGSFLPVRYHGDNALPTYVTFQDAAHRTLYEMGTKGKTITTEAGEALAKALGIPIEQLDAHAKVFRAGVDIIGKNSPGPTRFSVPKWDQILERYSALSPKLEGDEALERMVGRLPGRERPTVGERVRGAERGKAGREAAARNRAARQAAAGGEAPSPSPGQGPAVPPAAPRTPGSPALTGDPMLSQTGAQRAAEQQARGKVTYKKVETKEGRWIEVAREDGGVVMKRTKGDVVTWKQGDKEMKGSLEKAYSGKDGLLYVDIRLEDGTIVKKMARTVLGNEFREQEKTARRVKVAGKPAEKQRPPSKIVTKRGPTQRVYSQTYTRLVRNAEQTVRKHPSYAPEMRRLIAAGKSRREAAGEARKIVLAAQPGLRYDVRAFHRQALGQAENAAIRGATAAAVKEVALTKDQLGATAIAGWRNALERANREHNPAVLRTAVQTWMFPGKQAVLRGRDLASVSEGELKAAGLTREQFASKVALAKRMENNLLSGYDFPEQRVEAPTGRTPGPVAAAEHKVQRGETEAQRKAANRQLAGSVRDVQVAADKAMKEAVDDGMATREAGKVAEAVRSGDVKSYSDWKFKTSRGWNPETARGPQAEDMLSSVEEATGAQAPWNPAPGIDATPRIPGGPGEFKGMENALAVRTVDGKVHVWTGKNTKVKGHGGAQDAMGIPEDQVADKGWINKNGDYATKFEAGAGAAPPLTAVAAEAEDAVRSVPANPNTKQLQRLRAVYNLTVVRPAWQAKKAGKGDVKFPTFQEWLASKRTTASKMKATREVLGGVDPKEAGLSDESLKILGDYFSAPKESP